MATPYPTRCYTILPRGLPRERCPCCANPYVADPDDEEEEPCGCVGSCSATTSTPQQGERRRRMRYALDAPKPCARPHLNPVRGDQPGPDPPVRHRALMRAVIEDALSCAAGATHDWSLVGCSSPTMRARAVADAWAWLDENRDTGPFSFVRG